MIVTILMKDFQRRLNTSSQKCFQPELTEGKNRAAVKQRCSADARCVSRARVLPTLTLLQLSCVLTRLVSDSLVKYHGLVLSSGQTLQEEQITLRNVEG